MQSTIQITNKYFTRKYDRGNILELVSPHQICCQLASLSREHPDSSERRKFKSSSLFITLQKHITFL